jgi:hypothetical protein
MGSTEIVSNSENPEDLLTNFLLNALKATFTGRYLILEKQKSKSKYSQLSLATVRSPADARVLTVLHDVQTDSGAQSVSYPVGNGRRAKSAGE